MKTRKRESIVVLSLLICVTLVGAALLFSGCPGPVTPGPDKPDPPDTTAPPIPQEYIIVFARTPTNGNDITVNPAKAASEATVTVTLKHAAGYEPWGLSIYDNRNFRVPGFAPTYISSVYTYTFKMPASPVTVSVDFISLDDAIDNYMNAITASDGWDYIDALNTLIKKSPNQTTVGRPARNAINKLAGVDVLAGGVTTVTEWDHIGVVRTKMRNADLKSWIDLTYPRVDSIDKGVDVVSGIKDANGIVVEDSLGTDLTILYYLRGDNTTIPPLTTPGNGWQVGSTITAPLDTALPDTINFIKPERVREIPLIYAVGTGDTYPARYRIWLWPVAQYTVQYDSGAAGNVTLREFWHNGGGGGGDNWVENLPYKTLNANNSQATGYVGEVNNTTPVPETPHPDGGLPDIPRTREVCVTVSTTRPNTLISVYSSGSLVSLRIPNNAGTGYTTVNSIDSTNISGGIFYPESKEYTIRVRPSTPPAGM